MAFTHFLDCFVKAFDELHQISMFICEQFEMLLSKIIESSPLMKHLQVMDLKLAGSLAEGSFYLAGFYRVKIALLF